MGFELPKLNFEYNALEPHIDSRTMEIHYTKHHGGYVKKLNSALESNEELLSMSIEDLLINIDKVPEDIRQTVVNNGGGHANHSLFWEILSPDGGGTPKGELLDSINRDFGNVDDFIEDFSNKALALFGSGWVFLVVDDQGKLSIKRHSFQNSPYLDKKTPVLGLDVWEHAYYLKYQNKRVDYIEAFWNIVDWAKVSELYEAAIEN